MNVRSIELQRKLERIAYWEEQGQLLREEDLRLYEEEYGFPISYEDLQR